MTEDEIKLAITQARLEGFNTGVEFAEKVIRAHHAANVKSTRKAVVRKKYDWVDCLCGLPLIDKLAGIK